MREVWCTFLVGECVKMLKAGMLCNGNEMHEQMQMIWKGMVYYERQ